MIPDKWVDGRVRAERAQQAGRACAGPEHRPPGKAAGDQTEQRDSQERHAEIDREQKRFPSTVQYREPRHGRERLAGEVVAEQVQRHHLDERERVQRPGVLCNHRGALRQCRRAAQRDELNRRDAKTQAKTERDRRHPPRPSGERRRHGDRLTMAANARPITRVASSVTGSPANA